MIDVLTAILDEGRATVVEDILPGNDQAVVIAVQQFQTFLAGTDAIGTTADFLQKFTQCLLIQTTVLQYQDFHRNPFVFVVMIRY